MQYQSDTVDMKGNRMKDWSDENAKQFLRMCKQEQIGVINLVPITGKELICIPSFHDLMVDDKRITALRLVIELR